MATQPQSRLGIASFFLSLGCALLLFVVMILFAIVAATPSGAINPDASGAMPLALLFVLLLALQLPAACLGIAGFLQKGKGRFLAGFGTILATTVLAGNVLLILLCYSNY